MTVTGIMRKPAQVRATAPVRRLPVFDSFGREEEWLPLPAFPPLPPPSLLLVIPFVLLPASKLACATFWRKALSEEKYIAEPQPVRRALGSVPLQNCRIGCGPLAIAFTVASKVVECACCTRVLRRSAGCRRTAERMPELRPAKKWT